MQKRLHTKLPVAKPILGMLHLAGATPRERLETAKRETEILVENGVDAVVVENYFGTREDIEPVLAWLFEEKPPISVGINVLRDFRHAFELGGRYPVAFIQIDSVAGHLEPEEDQAYAEELVRLRATSDALLFGGVRFKYQPVRSGRNEEEDLRLGMQRCDAIVVTSDATGQPTDLAKVARFRAVTGPDFPLLIGAGMTADTASEQLSVTEGAIVGSYFKDNHRDNGSMHGPHVAAFMDVVRRLREHGANA